MLHNTSAKETYNPPANITVVSVPAPARSMRALDSEAEYFRPRSTKISTSADGCCTVPLVIRELDGQIQRLPRRTFRQRRGCAHPQPPLRGHSEDLPEDPLGLILTYGRRSRRAARGGAIAPPALQVRRGELLPKLRSNRTGAIPSGKRGSRGPRNQQWGHMQAPTTPQYQ